MHGFTPISLAVAERKIDIVRILLHHGAYANRNSSYNRMTTYEYLDYLLELARQDRERLNSEEGYEYLDYLEGEGLQAGERRLEESKRILDEDIRILDEYIRGVLP